MSFAFVVPRYGTDVVGGAESLARHFAEQLVDLGESVTILTTCVQEYSQWKNVLPTGSTQLNGVVVQRYPIQTGWPQQTYVNAQAAALRKGHLTVHEQFEWIDSGPHSPALYQALARQAQQFEFVFVIPYPFPLSHYAAAIDPARTVVWPCLHDEGYAYLAPTQLMLRRACGIAYNVAAEREFAETKLQLHHPASCVVGMGLPARPNSEQPNTAASRFRKSTGIKDPFLLYAGRNSEAKNVPLLLEFFARFKARHTHPLKLVLMGSKNNVDQPDVISIGVRDEQDKFDAYAAALALCQPSLNESLSIVMMEAWQMGTPAFVHRDCAVTRAHVIQSNGGLYFGNYVEFESALEFMLSSPELCAAMGQAGQRYVSAQYSWSAVMQRFQTGLQIWREAKHHYGRN